MLGFFLNVLISLAIAPSLGTTLNIPLFSQAANFQIFLFCFLFPIFTANMAKSNQQNPCHCMNAVLPWHFFCQTN
jgi:hypothetical protein